MFLVLLLPVLIRGYQLGQVPAAPEPFDTQAVLDFVVPDEQNAYVEYRQLATVLVELPRGDQDNLQSALDGEWRDVPQVIRQWVNDNRPAIELWMQGTAKPDAQYLRASKIDLRTPFPVNADMRTLARLVGFDAMRLRSEGHPDQAWELLCIGLRASHHMRRHGGLTDAFIGNALGKLTSDCIIKWAQDSVVTTDLLLRSG